MWIKKIGHIYTNFFKGFVLWSKPNIIGVFLLFPFLLSSCTTISPEVRAFAEKEAQVSNVTGHLTESEDKAIAWLKDNEEYLNWALVIAALGNRLALLDYVIGQGVDINQLFDCEMVFSATNNLYLKTRSNSSADLLSHQVRVFAVLDPHEPGNSLLNSRHRCPGLFTFKAIEHPRSVAALDRFIAAGAAYDQRTLDRALASVVIATEDTELADKLVDMGATIDQPAREPHQMPLFFEAATLARVEMVSWLLRKGIDPNQTISLTVYHVGENGTFTDEPRAFVRDFTALHVLAGRVLAPELDTDFLNPESFRQAQYIEYHERVATIAQLLIDFGVNVDATASWQDLAPNARLLTGLTPSHVAMFHRGSTFMSDYQNLTKENRQLMNVLENNGANQFALDSEGRTPNEVGEHILAARQGIRAAEQQRAQASASSNTNLSGNSFGQIAASIGILAVTGAAINSGVDPMAAAQIGGSGLLDIMTDGKSDALEQTSATTAVREAGASPDVLVEVASAPSPLSGKDVDASCENWFNIDVIEHSFLPIQVATPLMIDALPEKKPIRGGDLADFSVALESLYGSGSIDRFIVHILIPNRLLASSGGDFIDNNLVPGLENGAVGTLDAYQGNEYANFRTNFDYGRDRSMGSLAIESDGTWLRGSFRFEAIEDGYPRRGEQYRTALHGRFCFPG